MGVTKGKGSKYYAVKYGRKTGVFSSWQECQKQVIGFKGATYQSFQSETLAKQFMAEKTEKQEIDYDKRTSKKTTKEDETKKINDEDTCPGCEKGVKTSGVFCIKCERWWHYRCQKTTTEWIHATYKDSQYTCTIYFCKKSEGDEKRGSESIYQEDDEKNTSVVEVKKKGSERSEEKREREGEIVQIEELGSKRSIEKGGTEVEKRDKKDEKQESSEKEKDRIQQETEICSLKQENRMQQKELERITEEKAQIAEQLRGEKEISEKEKQDKKDLFLSMKKEITEKEKIIEELTKALNNVTVRSKHDTGQRNGVNMTEISERKEIITEIATKMGIDERKNGVDRREEEIMKEFAEKVGRMIEEKKRKEKNAEKNRTEIKQYREQIEKYVLEKAALTEQNKDLKEKIDEIVEINKELEIQHIRESSGKVKHLDKAKTGEIYQSARSENKICIAHAKGNICSFGKNCKYKHLKLCGQHAREGMCRKENCKESHDGSVICKWKEDCRFKERCRYVHWMDNKRNSIEGRQGRATEERNENENNGRYLEKIGKRHRYSDEEQQQNIQWRKEVCKWYEEGKCKFGTSCRNIHRRLPNGDTCQNRLGGEQAYIPVSTEYELGVKTVTEK